MAVTNSWLTPYQRSYQQIKSKLLDSLKDIKDSNGNTLITDISEGNILVMIISMFAAIAECLHYYIDNVARETFLSTARRFDSILKHGEAVDYHPKAANPSTVDVLITRPITSDYIGAEILISQGLVFNDNSGNNWMVEKDTKWYANTTQVSVPLVQKSTYSDTSIIGSLIPTFPADIVPRIPLSSIGNNNKYVYGSMSLTIGTDTWGLVETFAFSGKNDKHFRTEVDADGTLYIVFGDGIHGKIPTAGTQITDCSYYITKGQSGNVRSGSITVVPSSILTSVSDAVCTNPYAAAGGSDYETIEMLREHIPLHVRTLGVAITKQDFVDIAMQVPGVNKCAVDYECGRKLTIYITPDNGTVASSTLVNNVYQTLKNRAPLTTYLTVKSAGVSGICLDIDVTGRKSYSKDEIQQQIVSELFDKYSIENSKIGGQVRISDIYAMLDNLSMIDYLHINKFYIKPWPTTIYGNSQLMIGQFSINKVKGSMTYYVTFDSEDEFTIKSLVNGYTQSGEVGDALQIDDQANGNNFNISIVDNAYLLGYKYSFMVSEPNQDYVEPGFNLPIFNNVNQLTLKVNEVL